jgi:hypothetical protein
MSLDNVSAKKYKFTHPESKESLGIEENIESDEEIEDEIEQSSSKMSIQKSMVPIVNETHEEEEDDDDEYENDFETLDESEKSVLSSPTKSPVLSIHNTPALSPKKP